MDRISQSKLIKTLAATCGFDLCGIAPAKPIDRSDYVQRWLATGRAGSMLYLHQHVNSRLDPREAMPGARSVIVLAQSYRQRSAETPIADIGVHGRVATYAWGEDYHLVIRQKLEILVERLRDSVGEPFELRICVDTSPVIEREAAAASGIGWIGKNTLVLNPGLGSFFFLGVVITTLNLEPDQAMEDHCGTCTACLDACPTQAFPSPYEMDASRCISYLTIEHRDEIPASFHAAMGDWIFGCDICQDVCPHNRHAPESREPAFTPRPAISQPRLDELLKWSPSDYARELRGSAMKRAKLAMLQRNAKIALQNGRDAQSELSESDSNPGSTEEYQASGES